MTTSQGLQPENLPPVLSSLPKTKVQEAPLVIKETLPQEEPTVNKRDWKEFRETGLLFYMNQMLHAFGWAIAITTNNTDVVEAYPARVPFRGFDEDSIDLGYTRLAHYLKEHAEELCNELESSK